MLYKRSKIKKEARMLIAVADQESPFDYEYDQFPTVHPEILFVSQEGKVEIENLQVLGQLEREGKLHYLLN